MKMTDFIAVVIPISFGLWCVVQAVICSFVENELFSEDSVTWSPWTDSFEMIMGKLGLSDKKPIPEPVAFEDADPLGAHLLAASLHNGEPGTLVCEYSA
jgi:hypothetical protein